MGRGKLRAVVTLAEQWRKMDKGEYRGEKGSTGEWIEIQRKGGAGICVYNIV